MKIKFFIECIDYDRPYSCETPFNIDFDTTEEALNYCKGLCGRRDEYYIRYATKGGKEYDWKADELLLRHGGLDIGLENAKQKLIEQLRESVGAVKLVTDVKELNKICNKQYYL